MPKQRVNLGSKGLNKDIPSYSLPTDFFDDSLNMRFFDGSLQGVPKAIGSTAQPLTINPIVNTQYIPAGTIYYNSVVTGLDVNGNLATQFTTSDNGSGEPAVVTLGYPPVPRAPTYDTTYGIDSFVFNQLHILNLKTTVPFYYDANALSNFYKEIPNWIKTGYSTQHTQGITITNAVRNPNFPVDLSGTLTISADDADFLAGAFIASSSNPQVEARITRVEGVSVSVDNISGFTEGVQSTPAYLAFPYYARGMTHFQGRLIAFNLYINLPDPGPLDDRYSPIELAWSQPISQLQSLDDVVWNVSATNSAGNDYITETPGEILSAITLNDYLVTFKNDSVYRIVDNGAPDYLVAQQLYDADGIMNKRCVVKLDNSQLFVVGNRSIYMTQGGIDIKNISRQRMEEDFFSESSPTGLDRLFRGLTFAYHNIQEKEVWVCFRSRDAGSVLPATGGVVGCNRAWCYQYITDSWYLRSLDNSTHIEDYLTGAFVFTYGSNPTTTTPGNNTMLVNYPKVFQDTLGFIYEPICYATWSNRDLGGASNVKNLMGIYPHSFGQVNFQLRFTDAITKTFPQNVPIRTFDPSTMYKLDYRETGRYLNLKVSGVTAGAGPFLFLSNNPQLNDTDFVIEPRGRR